MDELTTLLNIIKNFFGDREKANVWLKDPHPLLGGVSPLDLITGGYTDRVLAFVKNPLDEENHIKIEEEE
jgi:uncharacterized protein (DUF2384 family)